MSVQRVVEVAETTVVDGKGKVTLTEHVMEEYMVTDFIVNLPDHQWVNDEWWTPGE